MESGNRIPKNSLGGALPKVQQTSEIMAGNEAVPFVISRIYAPPAQQMGDDEYDPRYPDKDTMIENIYLPSALPQDQKTRSGIVQIVNWLFTGKMR